MEALSEFSFHGCSPPAGFPLGVLVAVPGTAHMGPACLAVRFCIAHPAPLPTPCRYIVIAERRRKRRRTRQYPSECVRGSGQAEPAPEPTSPSFVGALTDASVGPDGVGGRRAGWPRRRRRPHGRRCDGRGGGRRSAGGLQEAGDPGAALGH
eukprot:365619-Chlamydomonas_euryale.AAC.7